MKLNNNKLNLKNLFDKIYKVNQDILLYDNHLITYKQINDVLIVLVSPLNENESLIYSTMNNLSEALTILLNNTIDKQTILEKFDMVSLAIDETIDDGIIIEYDPATIVSRVTNPPVAGLEGVNLKNIDISEKGLFNALSFASKNWVKDYNKVYRYRCFCCLLILINFI